MFGIDRIGPDGPIPNGMSEESHRAWVRGDASSATVMAPELHRVLGFDIRPVHDLRNQKYFFEIQPLGGPARFMSAGLLTHVSPTVLDDVRGRRAVLIVNCSLEGHFHLKDRFFEGLSDELERHAIPEGQCWYVTGNNKANWRYGEWRLKEDRRALFDVFEVETFVESAQHQIAVEGDRFVDVEEALAARRTKHYLCFNRRAHLHRQIVVSHLAGRGLLDRGLVSMPSRAQMPYVDNHVGWPGLDILDGCTPLVVDVDDFSANHAHTNPVEPYLRTYFSIVNETFFFDNQKENLFITEKTMKPIANLHPFVHVGLPHILSRLHQLGFKTFHPLIDESYDREWGDKPRMRMVLKEIERLVSLSDTDIEEFYRSCIPILLHNRNRLASRVYLQTFQRLRSQMYSFLRGDFS